MGSQLAAHWRLDEVRGQGLPTALCLESRWCGRLDPFGYGWNLGTPQRNAWVIYSMRANPRAGGHSLASYTADAGRRGECHLCCLLYEGLVRAMMRCSFCLAPAMEFICSTRTLLPGIGSVAPGR